MNRSIRRVRANGVAVPVQGLAAVGILDPLAPAILDGPELEPHADRMVGRYTYKGEPARGISLFAARGDLGARAVLEARMSNYRVYYRVDAARLSALGTPLPTFDAPHWTLLFPAAGEDSGLLDELLAILGPVLDNPKYVPPEARRR